MKKSSIVFLFGLLLLQCHEPNDKAVNSSSTLDKNVGEQISNVTADRWIKRFEDGRSSARQKEDPTFSITSNSLAAILGQSNLQGITFHNAIDPNTSEHHIIVIPLITGRRLFDPAVTAIDANSSSSLDLNTALSWIQHYRTINPDGTRYFFFGSAIFEEMLSNPLLDRVEMVRSINDDNVIQLVLLAHNASEVDPSGRTLNNNTVAYDMSALCPNACAGIE
jgi:hypothetical protein